LGMPTSTTVSIVFELLGASVAIAMFKLMAGPDSETMATYINSSTALKIISGILFSVVVAFISGAVVQYFSRLIFSFNFDKKIKYLGAIWGGIAITSITYFILIKGLGGSTYAHHIMANTGELYRGNILTEPVILKQWVQDFALPILLGSFFGWAIILQLLFWVFKIDILKIIVLVGTFALAMAFAGNDLVNFIGVPLAGFESYKEFISNPGANPGGFLMESLTGKVQTPAAFLVIASLVMVVTLWMSKKARRVVQTSLDLSRQDEGDERFGASPIARALVRVSIKGSESFSKFVPKGISKWSDKQFDQSDYNNRMALLGKEAPAFDMLRASINLVLASILISLATSYKLPLSTTYVTFMVAMGTSLSDKAWGRESAVYRITGVLSVILGWFFTAFIAFSLSFVVASFLHYTGIYGIGIMVLLAAYLLYKTQIISKKERANDTKLKSQTEDINDVGVVNSCNTAIIENLTNIKNESINVTLALNEGNRKKLKLALTKVKAINKEAKELKKSMHNTISRLNIESEDSGLYYVQVLDYLREMAHSLSFIAQPAYDHIENNHKPLTKGQKSDLLELNTKLYHLIDEVINEIKNSNYIHVDALIEEQASIMKFINKIKKKHVKRIKEGKASTKASLLFFSIAHENNNIILHMINLLKAQRDFITK